MQLNVRTICLGSDCDSNCFFFRLLRSSQEDKTLSPYFVVQGDPERRSLTS